jgi:predicted transcriptional regulator
MTAMLGDETRPTLQAWTAADLMTANPISVRDRSSVADAVILLTRKGCHAAPVIDDAGHAIGVLSYTDVLVHERERLESGEEGSDPAQVRDLMTPAVFSVPVDAPASRAVADMVALNVHQLYVVDSARVLVGVITALDILRKLVN